MSKNKYIILIIKYNAMDEVDYSEFFYRNAVEKNVESENPDFKYHKDRNRKPKRKNRGLNLFIVLLLAVCVLFAAFTADRFTGGKIKAAVSSAFSGNQLEYYLAVKTFEEKDECFSKSLLIRQSGAGGYIFYDDGGYRLIYSVFFNEKDCEAVAEKNDAEIFTVKIKPNEKELYAELDGAVKKLMDTAREFELGRITESGVRDNLATLSSALRVQRERLLSAEGSEGKNVALADLALGGIDGAVHGELSKFTALSNLRYVASSLVINMRSAK